MFVCVCVCVMCVCVWWWAPAVACPEHWCPADASSATGARACVVAVFYTCCFLQLVSIFAGGWSTGVVDEKGEVYAWGLNNYGQVHSSAPAVAPARPRAPMPCSR